MRWKTLLTGFRMHIFSPRNSTGLISYSRLKIIERAKCANVCTIRARTLSPKPACLNLFVHFAP